MSNEKKPGLSAEPAGIEPEVSEPKVGGPKFTESFVRGFLSLLDSVVVRDALKLLGWIGSILIIAGLCWALTQPVRSRFLMRAVNRVLEQYGDPRRLNELSSGSRGSSMIGSWYTMILIKAWQQDTSGADYFSEGTKAFVFSFIAEGTFFPCAAVVDPTGRVQEFIPLNIHGKKILDRISPGILKLYIRRIEGF